MTLLSEPTTYTLRLYQQEAVDAGVSYLSRGGKNGIIVAPTGSGKSLFIASIVSRLDGDAVVFQPNKEILRQNYEKLEAYGYRPEVFSASFGSKSVGRVTLATIGSVTKYAERFSHIPYVIIDECHLVNPKQGMYKKFLDAVSGSRVLGLTATPYRLASNSFGSELRFLTRTRPRVFTDVVHYTQIADLSRDGYLSPLEYRRAVALDRSQLRMNSTGADYTDQSVRFQYRAAGFGEHLIRETRAELAAGRRPVIFTRFTDEAEALSRAIPDVECVSAQTPQTERDRILRRFKSGDVRAVANVGIIALGFDYPRLDCVILARPTLSLAVYYQQVGRVMRPHSEKACAHVVDMVGVSEMFGRVEDMVLKPGGKTGVKWAYHSGGRRLTNINLGSLVQ